MRAHRLALTAPPSPRPPTPLPPPTHPTGQGDVKPENFLLGQPGTPNEKRLYLCDLGLGEPHF